MARLIERVGPYTIEFSAPAFETLARSIVYQQLSGKVALVIFNRLETAAGGPPLTAEGLLKLKTRKLRSVGLSRQKIEYLRDLAARSVSGEIDFPALLDLPDAEVVERLTSIKGIGVWTVLMFLIFALRRLDVMPSADLGIRAAVRKVYGLDETPTPKQVDELARKWRPYATVASWYLWRALEAKNGL